MCTDSKPVAIVTGSASGIGKAIALLLAEKGYSLLMMDKNGEALLQSTAMAPLAQSVEGFCGDVSIRQDVDAAVSACLRKFGKIDALVCAAGVMEKNDFLSMTETQWDTTININLKGGFLCGQAVANWMVANGTPGSIVNIGCMRASLVGRNMAAYASSKAGVRMLTKAMALELAPHDITVNVVEPGRTATDLLKKYAGDAEAERTRENLIPLGRFATPGEIAQTVLFLLSEHARYITGAAIPVDGGYTIQKD